MQDTMQDLTATTRAQRQALIEIVLRVRARARDLNTLCNAAIESLHFNNANAGEKLVKIASECLEQWEYAGKISDALAMVENELELAELQQGKPATF